MSFKAYLSARPAIGRVAMAVALLAAVLGLALGLSEIATAAADERAEQETALERYAAQWQARVGSRLSSAISLATSAGTFAAANVTEPLNHNGTVAERLRIVNPAQWNVTASALFDQVPGMLSLQLQPSGIISQMWPPGSAPFGLDTLNLPHIRDGYLQFARDGVARVYGPISLVQGGIGILARFPIYAREPRTLETWWGAGVGVFRVSDLLNAMQIVEEFQRDGYEFVCYARNYRNASAPPALVLASPGATTIDEHGVTLRDGYIVRLDTSDPNNGLYLAVQPRAPFSSGTPSATATATVVVPSIGAGALLGALVVLLVLLGFVVRHRRVPGGHGDSAAKPAPMVLVAVKRMAWWSEQQEPAQLQADLIAFEREAGALAEANGCHLSGRLSEGCVFVVASTCEAAHDFAMAANKALPAKFSKLTLRKVGENAVMRAADARSSMRGSSATGGGSSPLVRGRSTIVGSSNGRRTGTHRRSTVAGDTASRVTRLSSSMHGRKKEGSFEIAVTLHHGPLRSTYDADADRHTFFGACIAEAALAVDSTGVGEVSASESFATADSWVHVSRSAPSRTLDDGNTTYTIAGRTDDADVESHEDGGRRGSGGSAEGSVATALTAKTGATVRKRVAILAVELLPDEGYTSKARTAPVPNLIDVLDSVVMDVSALKGDLVAVQDTRFFFAFNALQPVTAPAQRAAAADAVVRAALGPKRRAVSAIALGFGYVAQAHGTVLVSGDAPFRVRELLDETLKTDAAEDGALEHAAVVDAATAEELKQAYELQCFALFGRQRENLSAFAAGILSRGLAPTLAFTVERPWPDDEGAVDDEWLYKLQRLESMSPFTPLNAAFEAAALGKLQAQEVEAVLARPDAAAYSPVAVNSLRRLVGM